MSDEASTSGYGKRTLEDQEEHVEPKRRCDEVEKSIDRLKTENVTNNNQAYTTYNIFHIKGDSVGVQIGTGNSFHQKDELQETVVHPQEGVRELKDQARQMKERTDALENNNEEVVERRKEVAELKDQIRQKDERMATPDNNKNDDDTKTDELEYLMDEDMIYVKIGCFGYRSLWKMKYVSRSDTVREVERELVEEWCEDADTCCELESIYSVKRDKDVYHVDIDERDNKYLTLEDYGVEDGDYIVMSGVW